MLIVGATVILIVVLAGMVSTTYVQFLKGSLLVIFSAVLTVMILARGFEVRQGGIDGHVFRVLSGLQKGQLESSIQRQTGYEKVVIVPPSGVWEDLPYTRLRDPETGIISVWRIEESGDGQITLRETQTVRRATDGSVWVNGEKKGEKKGEAELHPVGHVSRLPEGKTRTGPLGPFEFFRIFQESEVVLWKTEETVIQQQEGTTTIHYPVPSSGSDLLRPGVHPRFQGIHSDLWGDKLNFLSLMLALFCGTASLPHILIRYYSVPDEASARKSTIVGLSLIHI